MGPASRLAVRLFSALMLTLLLGRAGAQGTFTPSQVLDYMRAGDLHF